MPLSVLHVAQPTVAGVARCVADIAAGQVGRGWRVSVACPPEGDLAAWSTSAGATHEVWNATRSVGPSVFREARALRQVVRDSRPDVVHLHSSKAGLVGRLVIRGRLPTLFQPHGWSFAAAEGPMSVPARAWERAGARWSDVIVCVSEGEQRAGTAAGVRAAWNIVPNAVDLGRFSPPSDAQRHAARAELGLGAEPTAVCIARICRQKGQDVLVEAWPLVRSRSAGAVLALVGAGDPPPGATADPSIRIVGRVDDPLRWYWAADVVILPSRWEGMALGMLEAMACGRAVVASDVEGMAEALGPGERRAGGLVPPGDAAALGDAVTKRLLSPDLAAREGQIGRERVERFHDLATWEETIATLTEVVSSAPHRRRSAV